jgi:hypothetical protein
MAGPSDVDIPEFRPHLTVGRDGPYPWAGAQAFGRQIWFPARSPRARARHFAMRSAAPQIRPSASAGVARRVLVKVRVVKTGPTTKTALSTHFCYVRRGMEAEERQAGAFFDGEGDAVDTAAFSRDCATDRHHFRLVVNPEDGCDLKDIREYGRAFMARVERDLETPVHWVAGAHYDTGRPHLHIAIRGRAADGSDLVMTRDYIKHGLRRQAQTLATELLGPGQARLIVQSRDVVADGFTALDRRLINAAPEGHFQLHNIAEDLRTSGLRRLVHLETAGWVTRDRDGHWNLPPDLRQRLQTFGEHEARERAAGQALWSSGWSGQRARLEPVILAPGDRVAGAFVGCGPIGRFSDGPQILILDMEDGRLGHIRIPKLKQVMSLDRLAEGAIVEVRGWHLEERASDRMIAAVAAERDGHYSLADHKSARPSDSPVFIERHLQRLRMMEREGVCKATQDGGFIIPNDYSTRAMQVDVLRNGPAAPEVRVLDYRSLADQIGAKAHTYLDTLMSKADRPKLAGPFGERAGAALTQREQTLTNWGIGSGHPRVLGSVEMRVLTTLEIENVFGGLAAGGKAVFMAGEGEAFSGVYASRVQIARQSFAVIEGRHSITLAPWKAGLEASRGLMISGCLQNGVVDFRVGLQAGRGAGLAL